MKSVIFLSCQVLDKLRSKVLFRFYENEWGGLAYLKFMAAALVTLAKKTMNTYTQCGPIKKVGIFSLVRVL